MKKHPIYNPPLPFFFSFPFFITFFSQNSTFVYQYIDSYVIVSFYHVFFHFLVFQFFFTNWISIPPIFFFSNFPCSFFQCRFDILVFDTVLKKCIWSWFILFEPQQMFSIWRNIKIKELKKFFRRGYNYHLKVNLINWKYTIFYSNYLFKQLSFPTKYLQLNIVL